MCPVHQFEDQVVLDSVIPHSGIAETKPPYMCPGCLIHTYSNNIIDRVLIPYRMTLGSEENYITAADKLCMGRASTCVDRRRGLPNNRLQNSADIPDFHPRFHLNNDASKLRRLMVATHKYKETDMQASRRKARLGSIRRRQWLPATPYVY
jgi:hypothetical protein